MPSIYLINPATSAPGYHSAEASSDAQGRLTSVADLSLVTVAALVPDNWTVQVVDEMISPVDFSVDAQFIGLTGKVTQGRRMIELAREFRERGRTVLVGGSFVSLNPEVMQQHADILVTGELEQLAPKLFADLASGAWSARYDGGQADMAHAPLPRWDLYPTARAYAGALQTTRGCPFNCEFCDVIQYQGRKQRHKPLANVAAELAGLHAHGFRDVFVVDDNFTVHRRRAQQVVELFAQWNREHPRDSLRFHTQASLDIARDPELLANCHEAGFRSFFVGIETINEESLRETGKKQNLLMPIADAVRRIVESGIAVEGGVIVGFDHDGPGIFETLFDFFQSSPMPFLSIGVLTAPSKTDLHKRLSREGRVIGDVWQTSVGSPFETNILPARMDRDTLIHGTAALAARIYRADNFERRMLNLIEVFGRSLDAPAEHAAGGGVGRSRLFDALRLIRARGRAETAMVANVLRAATRNPGVLPTVFRFLVRYEQSRHVLDFAAAATRAEMPAA